MVREEVSYTSIRWKSGQLNTNLPLINPGFAQYQAGQHSWQGVRNRNGELDDFCLTVYINMAAYGTFSGV